MSIKEAIDHFEAGFRIFPLHAIGGDGNCSCGDSECQAAGKHPQISRWQSTPSWSDEQFDVMYEHSIETGYGIICDNRIILDVDKRNGGFESLKKINKDLGMDFEDISKFVVETGGGGLHIFFNAPDGVALVTHHKKYPGIDFKSGSGSFLVGCGSLHKSGAHYERKDGFPQDIADAPDCLIDLLRKPERVRAHTGDSNYVDISEGEIRDLLSYISPDCGYDDWIAIGMALHDATMGSGLHLWDDWSAGGSSYEADVMDAHWQSFGKCGNPITLGTIFHHAEIGGWRRPVSKSPEYDIADIEEEELLIEGVDLLSPPDFVGEITKWINSQCRYPRERLAVGMALNIVGAIAGIRYKDDCYGATLNTMMMGVAGAGSGKESVMQSGMEILRVAMMAPAMHGKIKSEQELIRNQLRHQSALYIIDEYGLELQKVVNAQNKGGAAYLEGVTGITMSLFTKADGYYPISGDLKEETRGKLISEMTQCKRKIDENEDPTGKFERRLHDLENYELPSIDDGIKHPFLSLMGFTTPETFDHLMTPSMVTNGFFSRGMVFREHETVPRIKKGFRAPEMSPTLKAKINTVAWGGVGGQKIERVAWNSDRITFETTVEAQELMDKVYEYFYKKACEEKGKTGFEAVYMRGHNLVMKISGVLAVGSRLRTVEHVKWAFELVRNDMVSKVRMAQTNMLSESKSVNDSTTVLVNRILDITSNEKGETFGVIKQRCKRFSESDVRMILDEMVKDGKIKTIKTKGKRGPASGERYIKI